MIYKLNSLFHHLLIALFNSTHIYFNVKCVIIIFHLQLNLSIMQRPYNRWKSILNCKTFLYYIILFYIVSPISWYSMIVNKLCYGYHQQITSKGVSRIIINAQYIYITLQMIQMYAFMRINIQKKLGRQFRFSWEYIFFWFFLQIYNKTGNSRNLQDPCGAALWWRRIEPRPSRARGGIVCIACMCVHWCAWCACSCMSLLTVFGSRG